MILAHLSRNALSERLRNGGLRLRTGPVVTQVHSSLDAVAAGVALHYAEHSVDENCDSSFADFHVSVERPRTARRWLQPQVVFRFDGDAPFAPLPADQAFPMLEWGMNWCVSTHCHQYITLHAAAVERRGRALILPAPAGSGKSTLCAGLVFSGWRLLSDELTVIMPDSMRIVPLPRPVSLKNASIEVIRNFSPGAVFGPVVHETTKGNVAHVKPPRDAVIRGDETALPRWIALPLYVAGAEARLQPMSKAKALMQLIDNSFNFNVHGRRGFEVFSEVIDRCDCYEFRYGSLGDAVPLFASLVDAEVGPP